MSSAPRPTQFGRIHAPDEAWLTKRPPEPILEPDLPIIDTHHHLWEHPDHRYLLHEFLDDVRSGHNTVATVFMECHSMYRAHGPEEMRSVGETEFVAGVAAMSDSGQYGPTRVAAGIVGFADLTLGDRVQPVLEALIQAGGGRFRGVRHAAAWDASDIIGNSRTASGPHLMRQADFRSGLRRLTSLELPPRSDNLTPEGGAAVFCRPTVQRARPGDHRRIRLGRRGCCSGPRDLPQA